MLGSIDSNTGSPDMGWDTDQFPMNIKDTTTVMAVSWTEAACCHVSHALHTRCHNRNPSLYVRKLFIWRDRFNASVFDNSIGLFCKTRDLCFHVRKLEDPKRLFKQCEKLRILGLEPKIFKDCKQIKPFFY